MKMSSRRQKAVKKPFQLIAPIISIMIQFAPPIREAIPSQLCSFFKHCSNGGGGSNPC